MKKFLFSFLVTIFLVAASAKAVVVEPRDLNPVIIFVQLNTNEVNLGQPVVATVSVQNPFSTANHTSPMVTLTDENGTKITVFTGLIFTQPFTTQTVTISVLAPATGTWRIVVSADAIEQTITQENWDTFEVN